MCKIIPRCYVKYKLSNKLMFPSTGLLCNTSMTSFTLTIGYSNVTESIENMFYSLHKIIIVKDITI